MPKLGTCEYCECSTGGRSSGVHGQAEFQVACGHGSGGQSGTGHLTFNHTHPNTASLRGGTSVARLPTPHHPPHSSAAGRQSRIPSPKHLHQHAKPPVACISVLSELLDDAPSPPVQSSSAAAPRRLLFRVTPMSWDLLQRFLESDVFNSNPFLPVSYLS